MVEHSVLSLRGRYREVTDTLGVKQTVGEDGVRPLLYLLCRDTDRAAEDAKVREEILGRLDEELQGGASEALTRKACDLITKAGYRRHLRELESRGLRIDRGAVRRDEQFDDKYVPMTNDSEIPPEDLVLGYRDTWGASGPSSP